jgi:hypothetical protein
LLNNETWNVADSTNIENGCSTQGNTQWTYNYGAFLAGAAYMYNYVRLHTSSPLPPFPRSIYLTMLPRRSYTNIYDRPKKRPGKPPSTASSAP